MIKNPKIIREFEEDLMRNERLALPKKFRIIEGLFREAVALGVFPLKNPLQDLETKVKIARVVNNVPETPVKNRRPVR
jgi:hypothetical protein